MQEDTATLRLSFPCTFQGHLPQSIVDAVVAYQTVSKNHDLRLWLLIASVSIRTPSNDALAQDDNVLQWIQYPPQ